MAQEPATVADIFRRAQAIRRDSPQTSYKDLKAQLAREYAGQPFPQLYNLTIPEQDARAPEEDWSAGLPLVRRGIQFQDWSEVANGIVTVHLVVAHGKFKALLDSELFLPES